MAWPKQVLDALRRRWNASEEAINEAIPTLAVDIDGQPIDGVRFDDTGSYTGTVAAPNYVLPGTVRPTLGAANLSFATGAQGGNLAGGETVTLTLYRKASDGTADTDTTVGTITATVPAVLDGAFGFVIFADTSNLVKNSTHYKVTGTLVVGNGTTATVHVLRTKVEGDLDAVVDQLVIANALLTTIDADIKAGVGAPTDAPVADTTTVEDGTARTSISLLKRLNNMWIAFLGYLKRADAAPTVATTVLPVQNVNEAGEVIDGYIALTNHNRTGEISPLDTRPVGSTALVSAVTVADVSVKYLNGTTAPGWVDTHSLNAAGGDVSRISAVVTATVLNGDTAHFWMIASNDSVNAGSSKRYAEVYAAGVGTGEEIYLKNGVEIGVAEGLANSVTWTNGTGGTVTYTFTVNVNSFDERYFDFGMGAVGGNIVWTVDFNYKTAV